MQRLNKIIKTRSKNVIKDPKPVETEKKDEINHIIHKVAGLHQPDYSSTILLKKGQRVRLGQIYNGPKKWSNWIYCYSYKDGSEGWVPEQILIKHNGDATVIEDYSSKELHVSIGDHVIIERELNGWAWCRIIGTEDEGWIPTKKIMVP